MPNINIIQKDYLNHLLPAHLQHNSKLSSKNVFSIKSEAYLNI